MGPKFIVGCEVPADTLDHVDRVKVDKGFTLVALLALNGRQAMRGENIRAYCT